MTKPCGCGCGQPQDRPGQRYRRVCHAAYMVEWRKRQSKKVPAAMRARYEAAREQLRVEVDAFFTEGR